MHRSFLACVLAALLLYGSPGVDSTWAEEAVQAPQAAPEPVATDADPIARFAFPHGPPHIALLLPLDSPVFAPVAEAVRRGFEAAAAASPSPPLPLRVYSTGHEPEGALDGYSRALRAGAALVVGPLTRDAVGTVALSGLVSVPTLSLNTLEADPSALPASLLQFGLNLEGEARQVARLAFRPERAIAFVISSGTPLAKRMQQAFSREWRFLGGEIAAEFIPFDKDDSLLRGLREATLLEGSIVFLAAEAPQARIARAYLDPAALIFTTSMAVANPRDPLANFDLENVRFVDMPWLVEPDHAAVAIYPRPDGFDTDRQRLYALGIDAWRIAAELARGTAPRDLNLDGVTGRIRLAVPGHLAREATPGMFIKGEVRRYRDPAP